MGLLRRAVSGARSVKPQHQVSVTMHVSMHKDANPHGLHQAQLNDASRAVAAGKPYNPRAKKVSTKQPTRTVAPWMTPVHAKAQKYYN